MISEKTTDHAFTGWYRRAAGYPWRPVVHAESEDRAWVLLFAHVEGGDKCVLPGDRNPNMRQQPAAPRGL